MPYLLDSNILLRLADAAHPHNAVANRAINSLRAHSELIYCTPQNLIEFWAVATRPEASQNGLGLSLSDATAELTKIKLLFTLLTDTADIYPEWERLVTQYGVLGKQVHDARLVAVMLAHNISPLLTFNSAHFARFTEITAVDPSAVQ